MLADLFQTASVIRGAMVQNLSWFLSSFVCGALDLPETWAIRFATVSSAQKEKTLHCCAALTLMTSKRNAVEARVTVYVRWNACVHASIARHAMSPHVLRTRARATQKHTRACAACSGYNCNSCRFQAEPFACCVSLLRRACDSML